jgi:hypothetical protein
MDVIERVKKICLSPKTEWDVIANEPASTSGLLTGYAVPLAAIGAVAGFVGGSLVGYTLPFIGTYRVPVAAGLTAAIFTLCMAVAGVFVLSLIINALAPSFDAQKDATRALKLAVYSYTPAWVAGVLQILPPLSVLALLGALYGIYLLYLGLPRLMRCPEEKAPLYTAVVVICAIVVSFVVTVMGGLIVGTGAMGAAALRTAAEGADSTNAAAQGPLGRLEQLSRSIEESARKMEAAETSGDAAGGVAAAFEGLGALFGGGRRVEPLQLDEIRAFVPETFARLPRTGQNAERSGIGGVLIARAEATYGDGTNRSVTLEVVDSGGISGLVGLASWAGIESEREDEYGSERTRKVGGRLVHERISKTGGEHEFAIVLGERFMVSAKGRGVDFDDLRTAVSGLDLGRLESMTDSGIAR